MKTFDFIARITISIRTKVKAETLKKALEIVEDRDLMQIPSGVGENIDQEWVAEELDGTPFDISEQ
jgi:hypothetical protein